MMWLVLGFLDDSLHMAGYNLQLFALFSIHRFMQFTYIASFGSNCVDYIHVNIFYIVL